MTMREKTSHQIMMISLLCIFELALSLLIIKYVSYTEIDWIAYGEDAILKIMPSRKLILSFKLGREKNIFVKFVFLCVLSKVEKFATKDRLLINQSHHHTIPPIGNLINPFSNHHTIIILKSIELRNICF